VFASGWIAPIGVRMIQAEWRVQLFGALERTMGRTFILDRLAVIAAAAMASALILGTAARADMQVPPGEADRLKACELTMCGLIVNKGPAAGELSCDVTKTWARSFIADGAKAKQFNWGMGDARCSVKLDVARDGLVKALSTPAYELQVPPHTVTCWAETGLTITKVKITLAPTLSFKKGEAIGAHLGITDVKASPLAYPLVWSTAHFIDSTGVYDKDLVREINTFIYEHCPKVLKGQ
jgi:hypothetical protein